MPSFLDCGCHEVIPHDSAAHSDEDVVLALAYGLYAADGGVDDVAFEVFCEQEVAAAADNHCRLSVAVEAATSLLYLLNRNGFHEARATRVDAEGVVAEERVIP